MRLWDWAVAVYAKPGVEPALLALQDEHAQSVCLLLWAVWAGADEPDRAGRAAAVARSWEAAVIGPARQARRALKSPQTGIADAAREAVREQAKALELQAERVLLEALEANDGRRADAAPLPALRAAAQAWGRPVPDAALADLAAALG